MTSQEAVRRLIAAIRKVDDALEASDATVSAEYCALWGSAFLELHAIGRETGQDIEALFREDLTRKTDLAEILAWAWALEITATTKGVV